MSWRLPSRTHAAGCGVLLLYGVKIAFFSMGILNGAVQYLRKLHVCIFAIKGISPITPRSIKLPLPSYIGTRDCVVAAVVCDTSVSAKKILILFVFIFISSQFRWPMIERSFWKTLYCPSQGSRTGASAILGWNTALSSCSFSNGTISWDDYPSLFPLHSPDVQWVHRLFRIASLDCEPRF